ncbi:MAG TPA: CBS domain-containing protein [Kofleriaceae bacterium]|jgi:CBS domain-containing protein|nr:CBS domain-containing protein [Kofleriaceae bacterium]
MKAGELCVRSVVTATADESVVDVARRMAELRVGDLIVVERRPTDRPRPIGIVTDHDLVVRVLTRADRAPATTTVAEVMQTELVTATEDEDVERIVSRMRDHAIRRIPIVDHCGRLQGMLSLDDVLGWMREQIEAVSKLIERHGTGPWPSSPRRR